MMTKFVEDLREVSCSVAESLKALVKENEKKRSYRGQRAEAQFVAEVYHRLLNKDYKTDKFFMEYSYFNGKKRPRPDLIYEQRSGDEVVEFKTFYDGDLLKKNSSEVKKGPRKRVEETEEKLKNYRSFPEQSIASLTMVVAYLGPKFLDDGKAFNIEKFKESIKLALEEGKLSKSFNKIPLEIIIC